MDKQQLIDNLCEAVTNYAFVSTDDHCDEKDVQNANARVEETKKAVLEHIEQLEENQV